MPVVTISDDNFAWLQRFAVPLVDKEVNEVITRRIRPIVGEGPNGASPPAIPTVPKGPNTTPGIPNHRFGRVLLEVLRDRGPCFTQIVFEELEKKLQGKLTASDWDVEPSGQISWKHRVHATKNQYKRLGLIEDKQRGIWALTDTGRQYLN